MGQCQYKVSSLHENGIIALNATTVEPWPIFNPGSDVSGAYGGFYEDENLVLTDQTVRFQCLNFDDFIFDLDKNEPVLLEDGSLSNYVLHTCIESEEEGRPSLGNFACYNAPTSMPTSAPSQSPSLSPTMSSAPSQNPTASPAPSSSPSSAPSVAPSRQSMFNRAAIDEIREGVQTASLLRETDNMEVMAAITALNQRLDTMEDMIRTTEASANRNRQQISSLRGYTERKIIDTQYWVSRAWYYNTQTGINWYDDNKYT